MKERYEKTLKTIDEHPRSFHYPSDEVFVFSDSFRMTLFRRICSTRFVQGCSKRSFSSASLLRINREYRRHIVFPSLTLVALGSVSALAYNANANTSSDIPFDKQYPDVHDMMMKMFGDRYTLDFEELESHGKEESGYAKRSNPQAVVYPLTTQEVQFIVMLCASRNIPIVPYGSGTSVEGHTIATKGGVRYRVFSLL